MYNLLFDALSCSSCILYIFLLLFLHSFQFIAVSLNRIKFRNIYGISYYRFRLVLLVWLT
jgi:hypothetical protein